MMTRKSRAKKLEEVSATKEKDPVRVFLLPDALVQEDADLVHSVIVLKHPKSETSALFLLDKRTSSLFELVKFSEKYRSWFIGNTVEQDGSLYIVTKVDPLFLILPYIKEQKTKFSPLEDLLVDSQFPESKNLEVCCQDHLDAVTDSKDIGGTQVYRFNQSKTFEWLKQKIQNVAKALEAQEVCVGTSSKSSSLVRSKKDSKPSKDDYMAYGYSIVADYLPVDVAGELQNHLGLGDSTEKKSSISEKESTVSEEPPTKKHRCSEEVKPQEDYCSKEIKALIKQDQKMTKFTVAQKKLQKGDKSGMKNISSFFAKK